MEVLFTFPSRYWFAIGLLRVFSLGGWARRIHTGFHVSRATQDTTMLKKCFGYGAVTRYGAVFQQLRLHYLHATTWSYNPVTAGTVAVWASPRSLATTWGIIVIFFSCGY